MKNIIQENFSFSYISVCSTNQTMSEKLCLQWNDFKDNIETSFKNLREETDFADVTLASEDGEQVDAHKVVLAASSPIFQKMLKRNQNTHPLIFMRGVKMDDLVAIVDFLYRGEANICQENLDSFLALAQELELQGLQRKNDNFEETQTNLTNQQTPIKAPKVCKTDAKILKSEEFPRTQVAEDKTEDADDKTVALTNLAGDLQEIGIRVNSMMEKTSRKNALKKPLYVCNVCGKEGENGNIKQHIEANHLEGVSVPCNFCEKSFRCQNSLTKHIQSKHKGMSDMC